VPGMNEPGAPTVPKHERESNSVLTLSLDNPRRAALAFITATPRVDEQGWAAEWMRGQPIEGLTRALAGNQVEQFLLHTSLAHGSAPQLPAQLVERLTARKLHHAANVVRQEHVLGEASELLEKSRVTHVVLKGALVRQFLYAKPYLRPSADVDLLVAPADLPRAARLFETHGYSLTVEAHSDTHEISIERLGVGIDLHWSLLQPGRMRHDITDEILANRVRRGNLWSPSDAHLTVAMLIHPAITDHVTGRVISAVDLDLWLRSQPIPWIEAIAILERIGLRTAAWAMLRWTHAILGTPVPETVWRALAPSPVRAKYLEAWLGRHPGALYFRRPWLVRGAFSLALQDRPSDAARALWMLAYKDRLSLDGSP
jgi:hypothetical protein